MATKIFIHLKTHAQLCQTCKRHAYMHKIIMHRNITGIIQQACLANAKASKFTNAQTKLIFTYRIAAHSYHFDYKPAISSCNSTIFHTSRRTSDCDNLETTTFKQSDHNDGTALNLRNFSDKDFYSDQHHIHCSVYHKTWPNMSKSTKPASVYNAICYRYHGKEFMHGSQLFSSFYGEISTSNISRNRNTLPANLMCCMFHTSCRDRLLYNIDQDGLGVKFSPPWKIMFFGTDEIALFTLKALYENMTKSGTLVESIDVVTVPQMLAVHKFAKNVGLSVQEWPVKVQPGRYDVGILVSFGHLIPDDIIHMFPYGILNMHPSLLPRWRGASPIIHTILNGDDSTGVSIMEIRPQHFDIGPLLLQRKIDIPSRCTSLQLLDILGPFGSSMVLECLKDLPKLERFEHEQDAEGITYAHKLKPADAYINWERHTATQIDCQYRAISELVPLKTMLSGKFVKLMNVVDPSQITTSVNHFTKGYRGNLETAEPGTVVYNTKLDCIVVKCKEGFIGFKHLLLKQKITAKDFHNGYIQKQSCTRFTSLGNDLNRFIKLKKIPLKSKV